MKDLKHTLFKKRFNLPDLREIVYVTRNMGTIKKILFFTLSIVFLVSAFSILVNLNDKLLVESPSYKGSLKEGIVGTPRFINPVLAVSDPDRDMVNLIYSGLMRADNNGGLIKDMAESYEISEDGLVYTFKLKDNLVWHDDQPITSDDIIFTIEKTKDPVMKSPKRASWEGVVVDKIDDLTLKFTLKKPYSPFLENTTIGILPKHLWSKITSEQAISSNLNIIPIGSGPYKIGEVKRDSTGIISSYNLIANGDFSLGKPFIKKLTLRFYPSENSLIKAFQGKEIANINAINPSSVESVKKNDNTINEISLPRVFGVFFNQNNAKIFAEAEVREALDKAVDREKIIEEALNGFGTELYHPIPPRAFGAMKENNKDSRSLQEAVDILEKNGWKMNDEEGVMEKKKKNEVLRLSFAISTSDLPELKKTAELLKATWESIGAKVDVKIFEIGDLNQNVIRPRRYDSLLFGEITGREPDPFVFWHSSQRNDPGLNIAMYTNITADKLLEEARSTQDKQEREEKYIEFQKEVSKDVPAIFIFSPSFIYITSQELKGPEKMKEVVTPSERFSMIHTWYISTEKVWKSFAKNK
ncbi:MAG: hypothetical protein COV02_01810 [Candidatus Terrybacteria bacterium CG10_big_fil_rev_8_21_14_0_10_41_10]|uniref:Solute-binding protein family 5 domain-containing protein n=1 Tax=Candidatus Terrybacteria bacterium CG10_big_fil_rev_8_21_14_0_10_41_10 TaxID=1975026 RepID=A0A2M8LAD1_9BACT|nr:MAG: hypothetical protein COV02_01810 [Candidatus Terrybacteria bacterium CG10_big_fil_rev_8_21_14_0_10_41_10]